MKKGMRSNADGVLEKKRRGQKWKRLAGVLGCLVVIVTAYVLMRPAETLERELICGMEEHQHSVEQGCYQEIAAEPAQPICGMEEAGHVHSEECYSAVSVLTCTEPEGDGHQHDKSCYTMETTLICDLSEADGHTHTAECYPAEDAEAEPELELVCELPEHTHTEDCYADDAAQHAQVEEVAALIDALPSAVEVEARLEELLAAEDAEAYDAYCAELARQVEQANTAYEALTDEQQAQLNIDKLTALFVYLPAKEGTFTLTAPATESGIIVTISGETASLPFPVEELTLTAVEVEDENANALRDEALESEELTAAENYMLDIRLMHGEEEVQPTGPITVTFAGLPLDGGADVALVDDVDDNADTDAEPVTYQAKEMAAQAVAANAADDMDMSEETTDDTVNDAGESSVTGPKVYQIDEGTQQATEVDVAVNDENNVVLETDQLTNLYSVSVLEIATQATTFVSVHSADSLIRVLKNGNSAVLTKDISVDMKNLQYPLKVQSGKTVSLDLNGYRLYFKSSGSNKALFYVYENATLTICDRKASSVSESVSTVANSAGNVASCDGNVLTYYVTTSKEDDATNHTTVENTTRHVVTLGGGKAGAIVGISDKRYRTDRYAFLVEGTLNIEGGYICRFGNDKNTMSAICANTSTSTVILSGGVIAANKCDKGGAISLTGGAKMTMTGGIISGNTAINDGGGVYCSGASFNMSNGYITCNSQSEDIASEGGGGVYLDIKGKFVMSGGYLTGNSAASRGGGLATFYNDNKEVAAENIATVTIQGGFISGNTAQNNTGGGLDLCTSSISKIKTEDSKRIYITNNTMKALRPWGGGGIYIGHGAKCYFQNVIITKNHANGLGGGLSTCNASHTFLYVDKGAAIFKNTDGKTNPQFFKNPSSTTDQIRYKYSGTTGNPYPYSVKDAGAERGDIFCCGKTFLVAGMLGNGEPKWSGSIDGVRLPALAKDDVATAAVVLAAKASPSKDDIEYAQKTASIYITGNQSATHGGGIMSNGILYFGTNYEENTVPSTLILEGKKMLLGADNTPIGGAGGYQFQFSITDVTNSQNPQLIKTVTAADNGEISATLTFSQKGEYVYRIAEIVEHPRIMQYDTTTYTVKVNVDEKKELLGSHYSTPTGVYVHPFSVTVTNDKTSEVVFSTSYDGVGIDKTTVVYLCSTASGGAAFTNQLKEEEYTLDITKQDAATGKGIGVATFEMQTFVMDPRPVGVDKPGTGKEMYIGMYCVKVKDGVYRYVGYSWKSGMPSNIVREFDTDTNGKLLIIGLPVGKYQMREKTAPEGYQIAEQWKKWNEIPLNATDIPSGTKTITVADPPATYIFQFLKVSEADKTKPVPNAKYKLLDSTGQEVKFTKAGTEYQYSTSGTVTELITDKDGRFQLTGLPRGSYTLREVKAPAGFGLADDYSFELSPEKTVDQVFTYTQEEPVVYELPETGGGGVKPYVITGAALLVGAACLTACRDKRRKAGGRTF